MAVDEFQEYSLGLLKALVPFDSAVYGCGVLMQQGLQLQEVYLHNKPTELIHDYTALTHADPVLKASRANPGRIIRFHPPTLFSGKENRPLFDYAKRYEHANGMSTVHIDQDSPQAQILSMWRADKDRPSWRRTVGWQSRSCLICLRQSRLTRHFPYTAGLKTRIAAQWRLHVKMACFTFAAWDSENW